MLVKATAHPLFLAFSSNLADLTHWSCAQVIKGILKLINGVADLGRTDWTIGATNWFLSDADWTIALIIMRVLVWMLAFVIKT